MEIVRESLVSDRTTQSEKNEGGTYTIRKEWTCDSIDEQEIGLQHRVLIFKRQYT